tara:strand:- start:1204 stop:1392 length:189 start_codon:yes stop_codon:yes gene_type:complete
MMRLYDKKNNQIKNKIIVFLFFAASYFSFAKGEIVGWILGMAFLICFLYGVVAVSKKKKFIF